MGELPQNWEVRFSKTRNLPYYYNSTTKVSQWEPPVGFTGRLPPGTEVRASHILVKHTQSRRPSSWKQAEITRSKEEAEALLRGFQKSIKSGEKTLGEIATTESDCSSASRKGDLGYFGRGQMQAAFEEAAFGLDVDEMSDLVYTDSGVHLILRTA
ncbi:hypothetical protein BJ684DRAFT_17619 [Piptocephalis cylindrospora]|uniref:Peptidyl-prolyl cis-trans isomerase n=1 Tax=Piptocephalis cylindrospora TaxID=1907219 RepID=A0A4P9Y199_9FUNG|nr:hypothetical protein BJ684DRAFT_17619 [Piptocephalis cylindrospora]|eukprot:RKP11831.1 hypothetical protein BJ684DRAFT_17619 [Piptocephalis cylindrospora]